MAQRWIVSPRFDLFFFFPIWFVIVLFLAYPFGNVLLFAEQPMGHFFYWGYIVFLMVPHISYSLFLTYRVPEVRNGPASDSLFFIVLPILLFLIFFGVEALYKSSSGRFYSLILGISIQWGIFHTAMQNYGILQIYHSRASKNSDGHKGGLRDPRLAFLEKWIYYALSFLVGYRIFINLFIDEFAEEIYQLIGNIALALIGFIFLVHLVYLARLKKVFSQAGVSWPGYAFFLYSSVLMLVGYYFVCLGDEIMAYFVYNSHHSICYLGLNYFLAQNRAGHERRKTFQEIFSFMRFYAPHALVSLVVLVIPVSRFLLGKNEPFHPYGYTWLLGLLVVHYYLEGFIWRFRNPDVRATIGSWIKPLSR